jgi:hypothetical protein
MLDAFLLHFLPADGPIQQGATELACVFCQLLHTNIYCKICILFLTLFRSVFVTMYVPCTMYHASTYYTDVQLD